MFWVADYLACALLLVAGVAVVRLRGPAGSVMALSALGLVLSLLFVLLGAPDDAHAEIVVGAIALPTLYLIALGKIRTAVEDEQAAPPHRPRVGLAVAGAVTLVLAAAVWMLPREHAPLSALARQAYDGALRDWHSTEPVAAIVYGYRGFDTLGETFILLAAVVGIGLLARRREPRRGFVGEAAAGEREQRGVRTAEHGTTGAQRRARGGEAAESGSAPGSPAMTVVVRGGVRVVAPVLAVAGLYLVAWGYSPGGGFPAGAVALGVVLLAYVAYGYDRVEPLIRADRLEPAELAGGLAIVAIGALGLPLAGSVSANFLPLGPPGTIRSGGILQAFSFGELLEVGTGLTLAVFALLTMGHDWAAES
ncbi:MnhB domain-containing protein [Dactylosporangium sp. CA-052675]|uniref:MnhB domain-containing protein n=1 Tax=Dactylosporangium sp. CA-052675 TaxID=3239927 RepID=UPI003D93F922